MRTSPASADKAKENQLFTSLCTLLLRAALTKTALGPIKMRCRGVIKLISTLGILALLAACSPDAAQRQLGKAEDPQLLETSNSPQPLAEGKREPEGAKPTIAPTEPPLTAPVLERTTVVILNGSVLQTLSYWLLFDPRDAELSEVLATMKRFAASDLHFEERGLAPDQQLLCVSNAGKAADALGSLWARLAHYAAARPVQFARSSADCGGPQPDFTTKESYPLARVQAEAAKNVHWLCQSTREPGLKITLAETLDPDKSLSPVLLLRLSREKSAHELTPEPWFLGPYQDLSFAFSSEELRLELFPYQKSEGGGGRAYLQRPGLAVEEFSCRMKR